MNVSCPVQRLGLPLAAVLLSAGLTACGGSNDVKQAQGAEAPAASGGAASANASAGDAMVDDFTGAGGSTPGDLTIQLPAALKTAMGAEASKVYVNAFRIKAHPLTDPSTCAFDLAVDYAPGGDAQTLAKIPEYVDFMSHNTIHEVPAGIKAANHRLAGDRPEFPMSKLTGADPTSGYYFSEDGKSFTAVTGCGETPFSDEGDVTLSFAMEPADPTEDPTEAAAQASVTVMKHGTLTVRESKVTDWKLDSNGSWIK